MFLIGVKKSLKQNYIKMFKACGSGECMWKRGNVIIALKYEFPRANAQYLKQDKFYHHVPKCYCQTRSSPGEILAHFKSLFFY